MKTLEQLEISQSPWHAKNLLGYRVFNLKGFELCDSDSVFSSADARLIAAAPKLYEAVYDLLEIVGNVSEYIGVDCDTMNKVEKARATLAEAAGESEANQ